MAEIFTSTAPGRVSVMSTAHTVPVLIDIKPTMDFISGEKGATFGMLQSVGIDSSVGLQLQQSLARTIYVYFFGERPGKIQVNMLIFLGVCSNADPVARGIGAALRYYTTNGLRFKRITLTVSDTTFGGYISDFSTRGQDAQRGIVQVAMTIATAFTGYGTGGT